MIHNLISFDSDSIIVSGEYTFFKSAFNKRVFYLDSIIIARSDLLGFRVWSHSKEDMDKATIRFIKFLGGMAAIGLGVLIYDARKNK